MTGSPFAEAPPVILTKVDALVFAAEILGKLAAERALLAMVAKALDGREGKLDPDDAAKFREIRREIPEPELQAEALRQGADAIHALALEERLVTARAASRGVRP